MTIDLPYDNSPEAAMMLCCMNGQCPAQERWLDNRECAYMPLDEGAGEAVDRRVRRYVPFSDGLKNCLGQVRVVWH
jgi:hypothetical protein